MRLVSLLTGRNIFTRSRDEYYAEAQEIVKECEVGSTSSEICHKLGKFYDNQVLINDRLRAQICLFLMKIRNNF